MSLYFNEHDAFPAAWLRELWPSATVDERSIVDVSASDVSGFDRAHFFGGIGGWQYALELAGWDSTRPVWTGSCPCQPFSVAGKGRGAADERHLWPEMRRLIAECRPDTIFGEQVASAAGREWLAGIQVDLEALGYAFGAADLCAAGIGAPHIRQRLFWVAVADGERREVAVQQPSGGDSPSEQREADVSRSHRSTSGLADAGCVDSAGRRGLGDVACAPGVAQGEGLQRERLRDAAGDGGAVGGLAIPGHVRAGRGLRRPGESPCPNGSGASGESGGSSGTCGMGNSRVAGLQVERGVRGPSRGQGEPESRQAALGAGAPIGFWSDYALIPCGDGKTRRFEPGIFPLAPGLSRSMVRGCDPGAPIDANATAEARGGRLRGYGNAIVPQLAATFIRAFLECAQ